MWLYYCEYYRCGGAERHPTRPHGTPRNECATAQAAPASAVEAHNAVNSKRIVGAGAARGTQIRSVNRLIMVASRVAARRGKIAKRTPTPAAMCAAPVRWAKPLRSGSHFGTRSAVA